MADARTTIELIDNAVADWETSADAMRWSPEPPALSPARVPLMIRIEPADLEALNASVTRAVQVFRDFGNALTRAYAGPIRELQRTFAQPPPARPERVRRLRSEYGRRHGRG